MILLTNATPINLIIKKEAVAVYGMQLTAISQKALVTRPSSSGETQC